MLDFIYARYGRFLNIVTYLDQNLTKYGRGRTGGRLGSTTPSKVSSLGSSLLDNCYIGGGGGNAILGHVHLENPKMALENMALNSLKWPLNQKY